MINEAQKSTLKELTKKLYFPYLLIISLASTTLLGRRSPSNAARSTLCRTCLSAKSSFSRSLSSILPSSWNFTKRNPSLRSRARRLMPLRSLRTSWLQRSNENEGMPLINSLNKSLIKLVLPRWSLLVLSIRSLSSLNV